MIKFLPILFVLASCSTSNKKPFKNLNSFDKGCKHGDGPQITFSSRIEAQNAVLEAIKIRNDKKLISLASCDFLIGPPNSDNGGFGTPQKIISFFLISVRPLKWDSKGGDYNSQYNLPALDSEVTHELIFKREKGKWFWAGYTTSDEYIYSKMLKQSYAVEVSE